MPAPLAAILIWLEWLCTVLSSATAIGYLSSLRAYHLAIGQPFLNDSENDKRTLTRHCIACERKFPNPLAKQKTLITPLTLRQLYPVLDLSHNHDHRLFWAVCVLACYRAMRGGELLSPFTSKRNKQLYVKDWKVDIKTRGANLTLPFTKMIPNRNVLVWFPLLMEDTTCPVTAMVSYLRSSTVHQPCSPLFLCSNGKALTMKTMLAWTSAHLTAAGLAPIEPMSAKGWRMGAATFLDTTDTEAVEAATKALGQWKSRAYRSYLQNGIWHTVFALSRQGKKCYDSLGAL